MESNAAHVPPSAVSDLVARARPFEPDPPAVEGTCGRCGYRLDQVTGYDAVQLLVDRLRSVQPDFAITETNFPVVGEVCRRLDGIPLALELAAGRGNVLTVQQIAARLDDRFRLLTRGNRRAPDRHRTLRAAVEWSYELLTPPEQWLFQRLTIFAGGCSLDAIENVCVGEGLARQDVLEMLAKLVDKSLVIAEAESDAQMRYRLLETLRHYGRERLDASGDTYTIHRGNAEYFLSLAEDAATALSGSRQGARRMQLEREHDNLRVALSWAVTASAADVAVRLAASLGRFWWLRNHFAEGQHWFTLIPNRRAVY